MLFRLFPELTAISAGLYLTAVIPGFFLIWGVIVMTIVKNNVHDKTAKVANLYLLLKSVKNLISGIIAVLIFLKINESRTTLLIIFGVFYLINLLTETAFVYLTEKKGKTKNQI
jgi:hypothetical protein